MKRIWICLLALCILLTACGHNAAAEWQKQYDLGVKYLNAGSYQEAVIAFTAAIAIDPRRPEAYIGRGDAYAGMGDTALSAAKEDYEAALALEDTLVNAWLGLADVYIRLGEYDRAEEARREGYDVTGDPALLPQEAGGGETETFPRTEETDGYRLEYDAEGRLILQTQSDQDGFQTEQWEYGEDGRVHRHTSWWYNGHVCTVVYTYTENSAVVGLEITMTSTDGLTDVHERREYTMSDPEHMCIFGAYSADIEKLIMYTIDEYSLADDAYQPPYCYAGFSCVGGSDFHGDGTPW